MAKKETKMLKVQLRNDWYSGARLLRVNDNPHELPETVLNVLPSSAKVEKDGKFVPVEDVRNIVEDAELVEAAEVVVPATVKKADLKL